MIITGDYITVAKNFNQTLNFTETDNPSCPPPDTAIVNISPSSFNINAGTTLNLTSLQVDSTYDCGATTFPLNSRTFYYEVIEPKVIYERIDKTKSIRFKDVTSVQTLSHIHTIPVTNTTWMQNPFLFNRGRVIVERYDDVNGVWIEVASMPIGGTYVSTMLPETNCTYRTRYIVRERQNCGGTSPIVFEAIGEEFELAATYYEEDNLYIKSIVSEEPKYHLCEDHPDNIDGNDTFTVQVDTDFRIEYDSYNLGYVYEYIDSLSNADEIDEITYNEPSRVIEGNSSDMLCATPVRVEFYGCRNIFLDGILTNQTCTPINNGDYSCIDYSDQDYFTNCIVDANLFFEFKTINLEIIKPDIYIPVDQEQCSYCIYLKDMTFISNPCLKGKIEFEYRYSELEEWKCLDKVDPLEFLHKCFCEAGEVYIRQRYRYEVKEIPPSCICGVNKPGVPGVLFETDYFYHIVDVKEYKPILELQDTNCCYLINEEVEILPTKIVPNTYFCPLKEEPVLPEPNPDLSCIEWDEYVPESIVYPETTITLTYYTSKWREDLKLWEEIENTRIEYEIPVPENSPGIPLTQEELILYPYTFTFDELNKYKIVAELTNCCETTTCERIINICDALEIVADCDIEFIKDNRDYNSLPCSCQTYHINNHSQTDTYSVVIYNTGLEIEVDRITMQPNSYLEYRLSEDGIYTFTILNETIPNSEPYVLVKYIFCVINKCYTDLIKDIMCSYNPDCDCDDKDLVNDIARLNKIMALYQTWMRFIEKEYNLKVRYTPIDIEYKLKEWMENNRLYSYILKFCKPCQESNGGCCDKVSLQNTSHLSSSSPNPRSITGIRNMFR